MLTGQKQPTIRSTTTTSTIKKVPYQTYKEPERQNGIKSEEVQRLSQSVLQPKAETDMWKTKYENQMGQLIQLKSYYELEIKTLSKELSRSQQSQNQYINEMNRQESDKNSQQSSQTNLVISELKKALILQAESYEQQLNTFRDTIEDQNSAINDMQSKIERQKLDGDTLFQRHKQEIDQLHCTQSLLERTHQEQMTQAKQKYDFYAQTSFNNLKEANNSEIELLNDEVTKTRQITDIKNAEIETLIQQNLVGKAQNEMEQQELKSEIIQLKRDLLSYDQAIQQSKIDLQDALERKHSQSLLSYKMQHQQQLSNSHSEILNLRNIIETKNQDVENLLFEKNQLKTYQEEGIQKLYRDQDFQKSKFEIKDSERVREITDLHLRLERMIQNHYEQEKQLTGQSANRDKEIKALKEMLQLSNQESSDSNILNLKKTQSYEVTIYQLREEIEAQSMRAIETAKDKDFIYDELKMRLTQMEASFEEQIKIYETNYDIVQDQVWKFQDQVQQKVKELNAMVNQNYQIEHEMSRTRDEKDRLLERLNLYECDKEIQMEEVRLKIQIKHELQLDGLKSAFNTQISSMQSEITELRQLVASKQRDYIQLLEQQQSLDKSMKSKQLDQSSTKTLCDTVLKCRNLNYNNKK